MTSISDNELFLRWKKYLDREFNKTNFEMKPKNFIHYCAKYATGQAKKGLYFYSGTGTGKTARMEFIKQHLRVKMLQSAALFEAYCQSAELAFDIALITLKNRYNVYPERYEDLIIDELGSEPASANVFGTVCYPLAEIIEHRYLMFSRYGALTHATGNKSPDEIKAVYGERVFSRMSEMCFFVNMSGVDRRLTP